jgi:hypothetical protein
MKTLFIVVVLVCVAALSLAGCGRAPTAEDSPREPLSSDLLPVEPWPEADALFRTDPKWLGSDDAYSVDLGNGRTLWLFDDSLISRTFMNTRRLATMIRNSVAIQSGTDPSAASIEFTWRTRKGKPTSFFPEDGETWFWPGHGIVWTAGHWSF